MNPVNSPRRLRKWKGAMKEEVGTRGAEDTSYRSWGVVWGTLSPSRREPKIHRRCRCVGWGRGILYQGAGGYICTNSHVKPKNCFLQRTCERSQSTCRSAALASIGAVSLEKSSLTTINIIQRSGLRLCNTICQAPTYWKFIMAKQSFLFFAAIIFVCHNFFHAASSFSVERLNAARARRPINAKSNSDISSRSPPLTDVESTQIAMNESSPDIGPIRAIDNMQRALFAGCIAVLTTTPLPSFAESVDNLEIAELPPVYVPIVFAIGVIGGVGVLTASLGNVMDEGELGSMVEIVFFRSRESIICHIFWPERCREIVRSFLRRKIECVSYSFVSDLPAHRGIARSAVWG